jgi:hypothetical protein
MDLDYFLWDVRYRLNRLRCRSYVPSRVYQWLLSKPDVGFKHYLKLAMAHAHIDSAHPLVKLSDDIQPRRHPDADWWPVLRIPEPPPETRPAPRAVADQRASLFFRLPPEVRNAIYRLACAGRTFHVAHTAERRMAVVECRFGPAQRDGAPLGTCCVAPRAFNHNHRSPIHFPPVLVRRSLHGTLERTVTSRFGARAPFSANYYEPLVPPSNSANVLTLALTCRRM